MTERQQQRAAAFAARVKTLPDEEKASLPSVEHALSLLRYHRLWTVADVVERHFGLK